MMRGRAVIGASTVAALASGLALSSVAGAAPAPLMLPPSSKRVVDYSEESCQLARQFGTNDDQISLILQKFGPGESFRLTLAGRPMKRYQNEDVIRFRFGPVFDWKMLGYFGGKLGENNPAIFSSYAIRPDKYEYNKAKAESEGAPPEPRISAEQWGNIRTLEVSRVGDGDLVLQTGSLRGPIASLDLCVRNLVQSWGYDPAVMETLRARPKPRQKPQTWLGPESYPWKAYLEGRRAMVNFLLHIDAQGAVTRCHIQRVGEPIDFEKSVCTEVLKRASFRPALNAVGEPVAAFWHSSVRFIRHGKPIS